jgi:hypothetical protein
MTRLTAQQTLWIGAGLALLCGTVLTLRSATVYRRQADWIEGKHEQLRQMRAMSVDFAELESSLLTLDQMEEHELARLEDALPASGIDGGFELRYGTEQELQQDWKSQSATLVFERVDGRRLLTALARLEAQRPPWRLMQASLQALPDGPGLLRGKLTLEGIGK